MQDICCLLASEKMFKELCECNEHRGTAGFEVRVHAEVHNIMNAKSLACKGDDFAECIECAKHMI